MGLVPVFGAVLARQISPCIPRREEQSPQIGLYVSFREQCALLNESSGNHFLSIKKLISEECANAYEAKPATGQIQGMPAAKAGKCFASAALQR
jgi:hypothetical protein